VKRKIRVSKSAKRLWNECIKQFLKRLEKKLRVRKSCNFFGGSDGKQRIESFGGLLVLQIEHFKMN